MINLNPTISDTLFHFTGIKNSQRGEFKEDREGLETLKTILKTRKFLMPAHERKLFNSKDQSLSTAVNMACFTETPLRFISNHIDVFGKFGLGVKISWAKLACAH